MRRRGFEEQVREMGGTASGRGGSGGGRGRGHKEEDEREEEGDQGRRRHADGIPRTCAHRP